VFLVRYESHLQIKSNAVSFHYDDGGDTFMRNVVITRSTHRHILEDGILHSHCRENLES
jgi:hypothetical protein